VHSASQSAALGDSCKAEKASPFHQAFVSIRVHSWLKNSEKSIDTPLGDQLKGAPSPALAGSAAGELKYG
jgi:hypothetical protein